MNQPLDIIKLNMTSKLKMTTDGKQVIVNTKTNNTLDGRPA